MHSREMLGHEQRSAPSDRLRRLADQPAGPRCRFCAAPVHFTFVDLGMSPLCESYIPLEGLNRMEPFYPLHVFVCDVCLLVQLEEYITPEHIFTEYAYFSSYSDSWVEHARRFVDGISERLALGPGSQVIEIASNDGYLLQHFVRRGVPVLGVEPAANVARVAIERGVPTVVRFFGLAAATDIAREKGSADLIVGNNVLAHVPDINDFVGGLRILLARSGTVTMEFPHLVRLMEGNQFDTIYHEHFSYLSLIAAQAIFGAHRLRIYDVEEIPTHGGSLRIYACHEDAAYPTRSAVLDLLSREEAFGLRQLDTYARFSEQVHETKRTLLSFLIDARRTGRTVVGYGAPGKGNTLLNYCGIRTDFLDYTVDRNPYKHGKFLPGTHIPIYAPDRISETRPNYVLILPWNLRDEIAAQLAYIREWGGRFVVPIPSVEIF
jgi:C-methyltransferase C-terminal domain/Putative zinc binding domain/Methyltransferase domain